LRFGEDVYMRMSSQLGQIYILLQVSLFGSLIC